MESLLLLLIMCAVLAVAYMLPRRHAALTGHDVALKLGLKFSPDITRDIQPQLAFINRLQYGNHHHALNVFRGRMQKQKIVIFDFRYEVDTAAGKRLEEPYCFYTLELPRSFPEVTVYKEGLLSKVIQASGHHDIDFESYEFSSKFRVRSADPKFAYDFCNARMIEYLLENTDLSVEIDRNILCVSFDKPLRFEEVGRNLERLVNLRSLMPDYLFSE